MPRVSFFQMSSNPTQDYLVALSHAVPLLPLCGQEAGSSGDQVPAAQEGPGRCAVGGCSQTTLELHESMSKSCSQAAGWRLAPPALRQVVQSNHLKKRWAAVLLAAFFNRDTLGWESTCQARVHIPFFLKCPGPLQVRFNLGCLVQVGNGIELARDAAVTLQFEPYRWRPCGVTWDSPRTVVVIKLRRTSALNLKRTGVGVVSSESTIAAPSALRLGGQYRTTRENPWIRLRRTTVGESGQLERPLAAAAGPGRQEAAATAATVNRPRMCGPASALGSAGA